MLEIKDLTYIPLYRSLKGWEWYSDSNVKSLFIHCLLSANHSDNNWRGILIKKGTFITSYDKLAQELGLSKQQIRTAIKKLISTHEITHKTTSKYGVITVNKWDNYQIANTQGNTLATPKQHSSNTPVTPNKKEKNLKNEENDNKDDEILNDDDLNIIDIFDFWNSLDIIKHSKLNAERKKLIAKAIKEYGKDNLMKFMTRYKTVLSDPNDINNYSWKLEIFLKQKNALLEFTDEGSKYINYIKNKNNKSASNGINKPYRFVDNIGE